MDDAGVLTLLAGQCSKGGHLGEGIWMAMMMNIQKHPRQTWSSYPAAKQHDSCCLLI